MRNLVSIRMRASRALRNPKPKIHNPKLSEIHISGAEGLYEPVDMKSAVNRYIERAMKHPKGKPDKVIITIENIEQKPKPISALPVSTINCQTPAEGKKAVIKLLQTVGISRRAVDRAFELIKEGNMRGAAILAGGTGERLDFDAGRGVRVSRLGIGKQASHLLSLRLSRRGINTDVVKEALTLASKVASHKDVIAELCVSDDPDYTTGYVASDKFGYIRVPNVKHKGSKTGGRAFFVKEGSDIDEIIDYLEKVPVLIGGISLCRDIVAIDEILNSTYQ
jgi:6-carboxyhexanoate--CoA ligase